MGPGGRPAVCLYQWQGFDGRDLVGVKKDTVQNQQASRTLGPGGRPEGRSYKAQQGGEHRA